MKQIKLLSVLFLFLSFSLSAQNKYVVSCKKLFDEKKFEKCIEKSDKYLEKDRNLTELYYLKGVSFFELYKHSKKEKSLYKALKSIDKAKGKKDNNKIVVEYQSILKEIQAESHKLADKLYAEDPLDSRKYYLLLVEVFQDTTEQYKDFYVEDDSPDAEIIKKMKTGELNQKDEQGRKQGKWKKVYNTGVTAYEATFKDDIPQGTVTRYHPNGKLMAELTYNSTGGYADSKLYNDAGKLIAKGFYAGKDRDSIWTFYKNDILVHTEKYKNKKLNGKRIAYFPDGEIYDERNMVDDKETGIWKKYHSNGNAMLKAVVKENKLDGTFLRYYSDGSIEVKGQYKNDKKVGEWEYYSEDGEKNIMNFKDGVAEKSDEIDKQKSEEYEKHIRNRLKDPANFINNPQEYIKK